MCCQWTEQGHKDCEETKQIAEDHVYEFAGSKSPFNRISYKPNFLDFEEADSLLHKCSEMTWELHMVK